MPQPRTVLFWNDVLFSGGTAARLTAARRRGGTAARPRYGTATRRRCGAADVRRVIIRNRRSSENRMPQPRTVLF
jgi:hypothetical protein